MQIVLFFVEQFLMKKRYGKFSRVGSKVGSCYNRGRKQGWFLLPARLVLTATEVAARLVPDATEMAARLVPDATEMAARLVPDGLLDYSSRTH